MTPETRQRWRNAGDLAWEILVDLTPVVLAGLAIGALGILASRILHP